MRKWGFLLILFLLPFYLLGQDYERIDSIAKSFQSKKYNDIESLVGDLVKEARTDEEKYRAFYTYMVNTFSYSYSNYSNKSSFKMKKGACSTLSSIYKEMCDLAGLECHNVVGFIKSDYLPLSFFDFIFNRVNHEWNIIKINNEYAYVDVTWGLKDVYFVNKKRMEKEEEPIYYFFAPSLHNFNLSHFTKKKKWGLENNSFFRFNNVLS